MPETLRTMPRHVQAGSSSPLVSGECRNGKNGNVCEGMFRTWSPGTYCNNGKTNGKDTLEE